MRICFVDKTIFQYNSKDKYSKNLRGAETVLINLSKALNDLGHDITIINNCPKTEIIDGINWININDKFTINKFDIVISNGDCLLFKYAKSKKNVLFSHSLQSIEKFIRKKQLFSYIKYRPKICFISKYHKKNRSKLLYMFGHINLRWAVDEIFQKAPKPTKIDNNLAILTSKEGRNQDLLINIWKNHIYPKNNKLKLFLNSQIEDNEKFNIINRIQQDQNMLLEELSRARVFLIPGHKAELFCLAAAEASQMCVPIVTLGYGCLSERVVHEKTGFIANNDEEFANYSFRLFTDNLLWQKMRNNLEKKRSEFNWKNVADNLINQLYD